MIRRPLVACLAFLATALPGADGPWERLAADAVGAVRWHGDSPARAAIAGTPFMTTLASPALVAALRDLALAQAKGTGMGTLFDSLAARGGSLDDAAAIFRSEVGYAHLVRDGRQVGLVWATVPEPVWERVMAELAAHAADGHYTVADRTVGGTALRLIGINDPREPMGVAVHRDAEGRCWAAIAPGDADDALAGIVAAWRETTPAADNLTARWGASGLLPAAAGNPLVEAAVDMPRIKTLIDAADLDPKIVTMAYAVSGLPGMGFAGMDVRVEGGAVRTRMALRCPGPRAGAPRMFDNPGQEPAVPAWIPGDALSVSMATMDLARLWSGVREAVLATGGDEARGGVEQMEGMVPAVAAGLTLDEIIAALGERWWGVDLPEPADASPEVDRMALVADLGNPEVMS
ncbi:MAG: hypothetical protein RLZZ127_2319, partial [Planctomycetota bacterium]